MFVCYLLFTGYFWSTYPTHICIVMIRGYYFEDGIYPTAAFGNPMDVSYRWLTITLCVYIWGEPEQLAWSWENMMQLTNQLTDWPTDWLTDWLTESVCPSEVYTNNITQNNVHDSLHMRVTKHACYIRSTICWPDKPCCPQNARDGTVFSQAPKIRKPLCSKVAWEI